MDSKTRTDFKIGASVLNLEKRFRLEDERLEMGLTINPHTREFQKALKESLDKEVC